MENLIRLKLNNKVALATLVLLALAVALQPELASAANTSEGANQVLAGAGDAAGSGSGASNITDIIRTVINILSWIAGVIAVIIIIIAGFRISVSNGDSGKISSARSTIIYALVGLVVVIFAQVIVRFVLQNVNADTP